MTSQVSTFGYRSGGGGGRRLRGRLSREAHGAAAGGQDEEQVDGRNLLKVLRQANQTSITDAGMVEAATEWFEVRHSHYPTCILLTRETLLGGTTASATDALSSR